MGKTYSTLERQEAIKAIISKIAVSDQHQLVQLLKEQYGIETNQAATSRDLRKLGIVKKMHKGVLAYEVGEIDITKEILKLAIVDISHNESMIVIKTQPGIAAFVGDSLDQCEDLEILGCIAGENVVFVTPASTKKIKAAFEQVCEKVYYKKKHEETNE